MDNLVDDVITHIFVFLDAKAIYQFAFCSKKMSAWLQNQNLWSRKLLIDYKIKPYLGYNALQSYQWCKKVPSITKNVSKILQSMSSKNDTTHCLPYGIYIIISLRNSGPSIDRITHELQNCGLKSFLSKFNGLAHPSVTEIKMFLEYLYNVIDSIFSGYWDKILIEANNIIRSNNVSFNCFKPTLPYPEMIIESTQSGIRIERM